MSLTLPDALRQKQPFKVIRQVVAKDPLSVSRRDGDGGTPLHDAVYHDASVEVCQLLVAKCPQALEVKDNDGWTPLHVAAHREASVRVVKLLVDKCPKVLKERDVDGKTPLHIAAMYNGSVEVVRLLMDSYPKALEERNNVGGLPLHYAAQSNSVEVVQLLINKYPKAVEEKNNHGWTPLHCAAMSNESVELVQLLAGMCPKALEERDVLGEQPLHYAAQCCNSLEFVQLLIDKCPEALTRGNNKGQRPVDVARARGDSSKKVEITTLLEDAMRRYKQSAVRRVPEPTGTDRDIRVYGSNARPPKNASIPQVDQGIRVYGSDVSSPSVVDSDEPLVVAPNQQDRDRVREVVEQSSCEPVPVSDAYVQSILTDEFLGDGFFGTVFKGKDPLLGCEFAIKSINTEILRGGLPQDLEAAMKTFRTEQEALSRFRHPNIAALYAYTDPLAEGGVARGYHLVYELAEKGSLDKFLSDDLGRSRLGSFSRRVQIAIDVLAAIRFLHEGSPGVGSCFHRDIKSANIVIKRDFTAQLIDCGLAKFVNDQLKTTGIKGTRGYTCPHYVKTGKYLAACDLYSFGVVLLELWTGHLQNHENNETGESFNFGLEYIDDERDVNADADAAMDLSDTLPAFAERYTEVALQCINEKIKKRPTGSAVLNELKDIFVECSSLLGDETVVGVAAARPSNAEPCSTCRTMRIVPMHEICAVCLIRREVREAFASVVAVSQAPLASAIEGVSKQIGGLSVSVSEQIENVSQKIDATLPVMAQLDRRLNNPIPRSFVLLPADIKSGWYHPRSWLCSTVQKKYYLYFVCAESQQAVSPPIKLKVAKDWVKMAAPVLASGLYLIQISMKAGFNVNLDLDGAASDLFHVSSSHLAEMLQELAVILNEAPSSRGLLDRLKAQQLSDVDVKELCGDAYELVIEKASEQNGWRSQMEPVMAPPSPKVFWVTKAVAQDPKYEIVRA